MPWLEEYLRRSRVLSIGYKSRLLLGTVVFGKIHVDGESGADIYMSSCKLHN
jgi:hypothetical protein